MIFKTVGHSWPAVFFFGLQFELDADLGADFLSPVFQPVYTMVCNRCVVLFVLPLGEELFKRGGVLAEDLFDWFELLVHLLIEELLDGFKGNFGHAS